LTFVFSVKYSNSYSSIEAVISIPQAEETYLKVEIFTLLEGICFFVLAICIILMFKGFSSKHITENANAFSESGAEAFLKEFDQNIQGKLMLAVISAFLCAITAIIAVFFRPYYNGINALSIIGSLAFVITFIRLLLTLNDEVYDKIKRYS
jgi:di/tricarboxylate transporter